MSLPRPLSWPLPARLALFALAYVGGAELGHLLSFPGSSFASFWPPGGVYLATLLLTECRSWRYVVLAALAANVGSETLLHDRALPVSLAFSLTNALEALAGAFLLRRFVGTSLTLGRLREVMGLVLLTALVSTPLGATVGAALASVAFGAPFGPSWLVWWASDVLGILVIVPAVLTLAGGGALPRPARAGEAAALLAALAAVTLFVFSRGTASLFSRPYPMFPVLLWAAIRFGPAGASRALLLTTLIGVAFTARGLGPFGEGAAPVEARSLALQLLFSVTSLSFLTLAAALAERSRTETNLRDAGTALRESEERYRLVVEHSPDAIVIGRDGRIIYVNPAAVRLVGADSPEQLLGRSPFEIMHPDHHDQVRARTHAGEGLGPTTPLGEEKIVRRDGTVVDVEVITTAFPDCGGKATLGVVRDISERRRAEKALRQAERRFRELATLAPVGIFQSDAGGGCLFVNERWCRFTGLTPAEAAGDGWARALHPDDRAAVFAAWGAATAAGREFAAEYRYLATDGRSVWVSGSAVALHDEGGNIAGYLGSVMDITARKVAEDRVRAALREKETLVKEVHHRVKNNLAVIAGLLDMQAHRAADPGAARTLRDCFNRVHSMAAIHEQLYQADDVAGIDAGPYLEGLCSHLFHSYGAGDGRVSARVRVAPLAVDLDTAVPLGLIVNELVSNALKHAFPDGRRGTLALDFGTDPDGRFVLAVADDGAGLPADFDLGRARSLGLRLVHRLAHQLGGDVVLDRAGGTAFRISFPPHRTERALS